MASATILVVEDHPLSRELVVDLLEAAGYTVLQAESGRPGTGMRQGAAGARLDATPPAGQPQMRE